MGPTLVVTLWSKSIGQFSTNPRSRWRLIVGGSAGLASVQGATAIRFPCYVQSNRNALKVEQLLNRTLRLIRLQMGRHALLSLFGAGLVVIGTIWVFTRYFSDRNSKLEIAYQACVGSDQKRCPKSLLFVKGDLDTVSERVERECEGYNRQSMLLKEAPVDCDCFLVEIKCSSP
jgi:hypothetical protein